jgi:hypothetical protein
LSGRNALTDESIGSFNPTRNMTKYQLFSAFLGRFPITIKGVLFVVLTAIELEDGSISSFNVTGYDAITNNANGRSHKESVCVQTID